MSEKYGFTMQLLPGCAAAYRARLAAIWPALVTLLKDAGISDYSIHLDSVSGVLFAVLWRSDDHGMDALTQSAVMQRWWAHMADLMQVGPDNAPVVTPLHTVFHLP